MIKLAWLPTLLFGATLFALQPGNITITSQNWEEVPIKHLSIRGTLNGDTDFYILLPERDSWKDRALHWISGGSGANFNGHNGQSHYALAHGAVFLESTQGHRGDGNFEDDDTPTEMQYEASYTVMQYAKSRCVELYGREPRFSYVFGTSAGGIKSTELLERFPKVYDGAVASIGAGTFKFPWYNTSLFEYYRPLLKPLADALQEAVGVNAEGDPFTVLTTEQQKKALRVVLSAGLPKIHLGSLRSEFPIAGGAFVSTRYKFDTEYFEDFWKYRYGGDEADAKVNEGIPGTVKSVNITRRTLEIESPEAPDDPARYTIRFISGALSGVSKHISRRDGDEVVVESGVHGVKAGDRIELDNRDLVAFLHYHRHIADAGEPAAREFYKNGKSLYRQRSREAMLYLDSSDRVVGRIKGKIITVFGTEDLIVWPTLAARYHRLVRRNLGDSTDDHFRIYWVERGAHVHWWAKPRRSRAVPNAGTNFKALDDLMAWVEQGVAPPPGTQYEMDELNQLVLPPTAAQRKGYQPVVRLLANDAEHRVEAAIGEKIRFTIRAEDPDNGLSKVEIDFDGDDRFDQSQAMTGSKDSAEFTYQYNVAGEYTPVALVTDSSVTQAGGISNLAVIRVVVN